MFEFHKKMKIDRIILAILIVCLSAMPWIASEICQGEQTVVDGAGRAVRICPSANLIVLITCQEIFRLLGVEERVVAVHRWVKALHPEENPVMAGKPIVGGFSPGDVNYEKIVEIANQTPGEDIVITYASPWAENIENQLEGMDGIKTLKVSANRMEHFDDQCRLLARVVNREETWREYEKWRDDILRLLQARLAKIKTPRKPRVYYDTSAKGHYDTVNQTHFVAGMIQKAGGDNVGDILPAGSNRISPEWLLSRDPDIIISQDNNMFHLIGMRLAYGEHADPAREQAVLKLSRVPGIKGTSAERRKKIYFIQDDLTSGPKQIIGLLWMAKWFYPDQFSDMDPEAFHKVFYERFMRLPYRGIHVYPDKRTGREKGEVVNGKIY